MHGAASAKESQQLEQLRLAVEDLRRRVAVLERAAGPLASGAGAALPETFPALEAAPLPHVSSGLVPAMGKLLLGIAGAYLLRAIAEAHILPEFAGTMLGLIYAAAWLVASARIRADRRLSTAFEGITASCIIAPLLWEATVRFHTLSPAASAAALSLFMILGQMVAWRRDHSALAGITALAGSATAIALIMATFDPLPFTTALAVAAAAIEYGACRDRALAWRWIVALAVDLCAFLLIFLVTRPHGLPEGYARIPALALIALLTGLAVIYMSSTAARTALRGLPITWFELLQVPAAVTLAIAGVLMTSRGAGVLITGAACLTIAAVCYAVAFTWFARSASRNIHAYGIFGLLLALVGSRLVCAPMPLTALWSTLAVAAVFAGTKVVRGMLVAHGAVFLIAAAGKCGLLLYTAQALIGMNRPLLFPTGCWICTVAAVLCYTLTLSQRKHRAVPAVLAAVLIWSVAGLSAAILARFSFDASFASTIHTAVISVLAILLAWVGRRWNLREMVWLLFPWMLFGAAKLVAEDFQQGRSTTLFLSLLIYGGTLLALPRLLRRNEAQA